MKNHESNREPKGNTQNATHTPGPLTYGLVNGAVGDGPGHWVVGRNNSFSQLYYFDTEIEARNFWEKKLREETPIGVIAAAPEMLNALKWAEVEIRNQCDLPGTDGMIVAPDSILRVHLAKIQKLIAKVEGR